MSFQAFVGLLDGAVTASEDRTAPEVMAVDLADIKAKVAEFFELAEIPVTVSTLRACLYGVFMARVAVEGTHLGTRYQRERIVAVVNEVTTSMCVDLFCELRRMRQLVDDTIASVQLQPFHVERLGDQ